MEQLLLTLALLACPLGMVLMMLVMGRGLFGGRKQAAAKSPGDDLTALRAEATRLDSRIAELESRSAAEPVER